MPTGFDIETGSDLSEKLVGIVLEFKDDLKNARHIQQITPENPISSFQLCAMYAERGHKIESPDIRAMVNYLRRNGCPIGSNSYGYFWALAWDELATTREHLGQRRDAISAVLEGLGRAKAAMAPQRELFQI